jgi:hypothetical protein
VREAHRAEAPRGLRRRPRCSDCHREFPCPTARVAAGDR